MNQLARGVVLVTSDDAARGAVEMSQTGDLAGGIGSSDRQEGLEETTAPMHRPMNPSESTYT
ncbi:hypothetical protein ACWGQ9_05135 [Streptomyces parvus]